MSMTEFAMIEELAFLVKDNLPCKHLVLSMEESFVNFLQDNPSSDGVLELESMNAYNRLLLHRLADIFGFSHQSVGEGDDRHLILERCPETLIPSVLVSDLLWQYDELQLPITSHRLLKRNEASPALKAEKTAAPFSLEEREVAYKAARERIFTRYAGEMSEPMQQKPRSIPVVALHMIAHALGGRINSSNQEVGLKDPKEHGEKTDGTNIREK
ncbi:R3H domain-containing protein [Actinidia chinensis var. chinensis]|uniref:R3H domain-containing protein n=1 Tax=Actinidia chinensis var. chinensis TaxID=1590841 RepID=A0A2R6QAW3_ACTCC|nr:R3H domain-containing protein [Actinidia chinensis var. chinensis]